MAVELSWVDVYFLDQILFDLTGVTFFWKKTLLKLLSWGLAGHMQTDVFYFLLMGYIDSLSMFVFNA